MTNLKTIPSEDVDSLSPQVLIVEAAGGHSRRRWMEERLNEAANAGSRTFGLSCHFDEGGPWAGVNELFSTLLAELQSQRPDLVEHHSLELVYVMPRLRRSLTVKNPTLTDLATAEERVRSYPVDRAFRTLHGLIDLLDAWKKTNAADTPWVIACDSYDGAGTMSSRFFTELMRRRGESLRLRILVGVEPGRGEEVRALFSAVPGEVALVALDLPVEPVETINPSKAAEMATRLEEQTGDDRIETTANLPDLIRLWQQARRTDKVLKYRRFGLDLYNTLGLYADSFRYGDGLLELATEYEPSNERMQWAIAGKMLNVYLGVQDVPTTLKLAEGPVMELAQHDQARLGIVLYMLAMLYARYQKPRDLRKGEEYLDRGIAALEQAREQGAMPEDEFHFQTVFNRNGLAMIRNFQGRHREAIELCRDCVAQLNSHLAADKHRLHRSVLLYNLGQVYLAIGSHEQAIEHYTAAIAMDPNYSEYYNERGSIFLHLGRLKEAQADYLKAIELSPPYFEVLTNLGQCYRRMGAVKNAIESYSRAIDIEPNHVLALLGRAKAHEDQGDFGPAIADYTAAIARDPSLWDAFAGRGVMYYEAGNLESSLLDFNRAIELKPDQGDLYENRATVLTDLGRRHDAARDLEAALKLASTKEDQSALQARLEGFLRAEVGGKAS